MPSRVSVAILRFNCVFFLAASHVKSSERDYLFPDIEQELFIKQQSEFYVDHPEKVDGNGKLISYSLSHHFRRHKRDLNSAERRVFYKLNYKGQEFTLSLTTNDNLLSNEYVLKKHNRSLTEKRSQTSGNLACHLIGTVMDGNEQGTAAISTCEGLAIQDVDEFVSSLEQIFFTDMQLFTSQDVN